MRHTRTTVLLAACLLAAGCSSSDDEPKPAASSTAPPSLSEADARQACVTEWLAVMHADDYDPDAGIEARPDVCEGLSGQADMYAEALRERNEENRARLEECVEDPACTEMPVP